VPAGAGESRASPAAIAAGGGVAGGGAW